MILPIALLVGPILATIVLLVVGNALNANPELIAAGLFVITVVGGTALGFFGDGVPELLKRWQYPHRRPSSKPPEGPDDLRGSARINMTDEELIYFSMGPWDMEKDE